MTEKNFRAMLHAGAELMQMIALSLDNGISKLAIMKAVRKAKPELTDLIGEAIDYYQLHTERANELLAPYRR